MNYSQLKNAIAEVIRTNGNEEITGEVLQYTLLEMVSVLGKDYQFAGVGTPLTDTTERDDNVAWILGRGTYENFGNPFTVAVDEIAVVKYDGTFTVEKIKTGVVVDSELTLEGTNPVEGGAIAREFAKMRAAGYIFAGIMTPTGTPPHEITEKIFYLCTQAGVYPNFDSIVLDRGLNILKWNGSRWSADLVFAITDDVTEGLASLLTSAGAYAAIAAEAQLRQEGDAAVQQNIDAVEALIPSQASVDNKLVDEQKMNSSIATATATYRGAYNQVSNLNLGVDATHEQVALALASQMTYLHITPDNNDYCYVLVPNSAETPTEIAHIDRYKYNGTAWGYEYTLNNSGYTAAQWAAINSGITSGLVAKLGALPTAQELAAALLTKQDVLTFDNAPTPSSTNPVTSGGVYTAIDDEKGARVNADAALQQAIEAILLLIPSAATALNQLADKAFVNSSIATATATFRGTFNLVSDLQLTVDATHADIAAALLNAISGADNNDYAFVQIPTSVDTPTEIRVTERYKFNGTAWQYEYDLNNSGFTAAQWAAINSGITALLVTKLSNLPDATQLATLFAGKQNTLTFDDAPVSGSDNPVKSGGLYNLFAAIDAKMPTGASANNKLVAEDRLAAYVGGIIGALDATFDLTSTDGHVTLRMTQTDGVIASLQILTSDIASASALATLGGQVSTNASDIAALQALYNALQQSAPEIIQPTDTWPVANPSDTVIYRVIDRVNTPPQYYSDYMWNGTSMVLMATYNNAIDPRPIKGSSNLVTSGGVFDNIGALDISELNASGGTLATYATLDAALAAIPADYQKGGMSIKFVQSSDNKYVQYRLISQNWSTHEIDWLCIDDIRVVNSVNKNSINFTDENGNVILRLLSGLFVDENGNIITDSFNSTELLNLNAIATSPYDIACAKRQFLMAKNMMAEKAVDKFNRVVVVFNGDSIFGSQLNDVTQVSDFSAGTFAPNMSRKIVPYKFLNEYQFANADVQYRNIKHTDWVKSTGAFSIDPTYNDTFNNIETRATANIDDYAEITVTGYKFFKLIWSEWKENAPYKFQVLCSIDGGEYAPCGISEIISHTSEMGCMQKYAVIEIDPTKTYKFKVTAKENPTNITFWGCEYWNNPRLDVVVESFSGSTAREHVNYLLDSYCSEWNKPAFIISNVLCLNDQSWMVGTSYSVSQWQKFNADIVKKCGENGIPLLFITPHALVDSWLTRVAEGLPASMSLPFIDIAKCLNEESKSASYVTGNDGLHLSNQGNNYYFSKIREVFD